MNKSLLKIAVYVCAALECKRNIVLVLGPVSLAVLYLNDFCTFVKYSAKKCPEESCKIHRKTSVSGSL